MGQVRHGSATITQAVRAAIQRLQASLATQSRGLGVDPETLAKQRKRSTVEDLKTGLKPLIQRVARGSGGGRCRIFRGTRCCRSTTACMRCR